MAKSIRTQRVNHLNAVIEDFDASLSHFQRLYDSTMLMDLPSPLWHAYLIDVGRAIFEMFAPPAFLLNARQGPHFLGIEYQCDLEEAREVLAAHGVRILRDIDVAVHTHPADCFGVSLEFYAGDFHDRDLALGRTKPLEYWRDEHPLGLTDLKAYTVAVLDLDKARGFFTSLLQCELVYEQDRPAAAARVVGLRTGGAVLELAAPTGDGVIQRQLVQSGEGIVSALFGVRNLEQARRAFRDRGVELVPGTTPGALAIPPELNVGLLFEFAE